MCSTEYIAAATAVLVFISEALPFLSHKSNGILHFIYVCWNSDCMKENVALKEPEIEEKPNIDVVLTSDDDCDYYSDY